VLAGTQVGAYRVLERIGAGGMGEVWLAEHAMLGRRAAIKVLHAEYSSRAEIVTRFFNEARAATAIADPGIVQIFDFGHHVDGSAFIVMELLDGEPLDKRLARLGVLALPDALRILRQVATTLGAAHARGIVHRDLKPENIFLVRDPEVAGGERAKILDFGIAKLGGNAPGVKTQTSAMMGTPTYMSPEQCRGAGHVDQRSDVYSLGCVLFTLVVGRPPFDAEGVGEIIAMHLREAPPRASTRAPRVTPAVDELISRCLEKDPARRFASGTELASAIDVTLKISSGQAPATAGGEVLRAPASNPSGAPIATTLSTASGASMQPPTSTKRSRAGLFIGLGLVVVVGGAIAIATTRESSDATATAEQLGSATHDSTARAMETPALDAGVTVAGGHTEARAEEPQAIDAAVVSPPDAPTTIDVVIDTVPSGSEVMLDGHSLGTTPFRRALPRGDRQLHFVIRRAGFVEQRFAQSAADDIKRSITLLAVPPRPRTPSGSATHRYDDNEGINPLRP
jgi:serine/threonine-protein kinase